MKRVYALAGVCLGLAAVTGCGSVQGNSGQQNTSTGTSPDKTYTIGVTIPTEANTELAAWYHAIQASAQVHDMKVIGIDDQLSVSKQVNDIKTLLADHVNAIIVWPLDAASVNSTIQDATNQHVPVFGIDFNTELGGSQYGLASQVVLNRNQAATNAAALMAKKLGKGAEVAGIGLATPVPGNIYLMNAFKQAAQQDGLRYVGQENNPTDNQAGAKPLATSLLTKYPNLKGIFCYNDPSAAGSVQAVLEEHKTLYSNGNPSGVMVVGVNAQSVGINSIKAGQEYATFNLEPVASGVALVDATYNDLTHAGPVPKQILISAPEVDAANISSFVSWDSQIASIRTSGKQYLEPKTLQ